MRKGLKKSSNKLVLSLILGILIVCVGVSVLYTPQKKVSFSPTEVGWMPSYANWYFTPVGDGSVTKNSDSTITVISNGGDITLKSGDNTSVTGTYVKTRVKYKTEEGYDESKYAYHKLFFADSFGNQLNEGTFLLIKNTGGNITSDERIFKVPAGAVSVSFDYLRTMPGGNSKVTYYGADYEFLNPSCSGKCGTYYEYGNNQSNGLGCSCDDLCTQYGDCCGDYESSCNVQSCGDNNCSSTENAMNCPQDCISVIYQDNKDKNYLSFYNNKLAWEEGGYHVSLYDLEKKQFVALSLTDFSSSQPYLYRDFIARQERNLNFADYTINILLYNFVDGSSWYISPEVGASQRESFIQGDSLVYADRDKIYLYNITTKDKSLVVSGGNFKYSPKIYGDYLVYMDGQAGQIRVKNLVSGQIIGVTNNQNYHLWESIYGNKVVFSEQNYFNQNINDVYLYDINTGISKKLNSGSSAFSPNIFGNFVVWKDKRNVASGAYYDIYLYNLGDNTEIRLTPTPLYSLRNPIIFENKIFWSAKNSSSNLYGIYMAKIY